MRLQQFFISSVFSEHFGVELLAVLLLTVTATIITNLFFHKKILEARQELNKEIIGRKQAEEVLVL
ncbi:MAG: hypothetical protein WBA07_23590, partial [Rivularia sp. (in: cyanobacteria)]